VTVSSVGAAGATLTASLSNVTFGELDASRNLMSNGCTSTVAGDRSAAPSRRSAAVVVAEAAGAVVAAGARHVPAGRRRLIAAGGGMCPQVVGD